MLGSETKQKIQNLRDTLVGKIPVPTEQVKQITLGLIYKFMSDIDQENKELGSKSFFRGDYEKYSWHKIMDRGLSSYDRVLLYSEGLEKMAINPNIPQLFRDIFKGAFLPFRDPAIVNEFLKGINEFKYEHSEDLGDAFEFLLMVMDAQGDAGQFRTPRHIIDFIVQAVDPQKTEKILDPACGTAGFLVGAYKHILKQNTSPNSSRPGSALTTTQRNNLSKNFVGYDISHDMVRLSLVNMYLHQFSDPKIYEYDTLTSLDRWEDNFDCILANPPFMTPRGGIRPHNRFAIRANRSEVLFVDYIIEHLSPSGKAGIIVPEGIPERQQIAYKALRKILVTNDYLYAVVSLPPGVFNPYSNVRTSILLIDKTLAKKTKSILFVKITNDGFDLGAQRRPIDRNDLPKAVELIARYKQAVIEEKEITFINKYSDFASIVLRDKIAKKDDYILSGERYKEQTISIKRKWPMVELGEICEIFSGSRPKGGATDDGILSIGGEHINYDGTFNLTNPKYIPESYFRALKRGKLELGDVLVVKDGATTGKVGYFSEKFAIKTAAINEHVFILRIKEKKIPSLFLFNLLKAERGQTELLKHKVGAAQGGINLSIKSIQIPLPPFEIQEEINAELDDFQKIIDGARQVSSNYRPQINIDSAWDIVELSEIVEVNPKKDDLRNINADLEVSFVPMTDLNKKGYSFEIKEKRKLKEVIKGYTDFRNNDILLAKITPCFENGKAGIARDLMNGVGFGSTEFIVLRPTARIIPEIVYYYLSEKKFLILGAKKMTGTAGQQRLPIDFVKHYKISLPPFEIQKQIVTQLEEERKLVEANKRLVEVFEQKIKDKIRKIWEGYRNE